MMKPIVVGSMILVGSTWLAGCGLSGNMTATPMGKGHYNISGTVHTNNTPSSASQSSTSSPSTTSSSAASSTSSSTLHTASSSGGVAIFSQSDLEEIYVTLSYRSIGPIAPPQPILHEVSQWAKDVSPLMLSHVAPSQQRLDGELITAIQHMIANQPWTPVTQLPGYALRNRDLPSGNSQYWWPIAGAWPKWIAPSKNDA